MNLHFFKMYLFLFYFLLLKQFKFVTIILMLHKLLEILQFLKNDKQLTFYILKFIVF
jgi:hypothetical protein